MISRFGGRRRWWLVLGWFLILARGYAEGADPAMTSRDTLAYKDGDRVQGKLLERTGDMIIFKSDRFGELRVPAADAVVIKAEQPAGGAGKPVAGSAATPSSGGTRSAAERAEAERLSIWEWFSPSVLTARVRNYFGPWHGRVAFSTEVYSQATKQDNTTLEAHLQRKWERDEVQLNARFDYAEASHIATTDVFKATASWRHDFNLREFAQYRPTLEWNRASTRNGVPNHYVLLQQEIGVGLNFVAQPGRKLRFGISENLFDTWNSAPTPDHVSRGVGSIFDETEINLPWRMVLSQRGVWYPVRNQEDGWENRIELNKKLTETLSVALRHEIRRHSPDGSAPDYTRLKLLFGLDF